MNKIETLLGFASKAGQLVTGSAAVAAAIKKKRVHLVICAKDLAERTIKDFNTLCRLRNIKFYRYGTLLELGHRIGRPGRGVIGVVSKQFAGTIASLIEEDGIEN